MRTMPLGAAAVHPDRPRHRTELYEWSQRRRRQGPHPRQEARLPERSSGSSSAASWFLASVELVRLAALSRTRARRTHSGILQAHTRRRALERARPAHALPGGVAGRFDWIMSLDPHWFSTMFGVIFLAGGALGFMAVLIVICLALRSGRLSGATRSTRSTITTSANGSSRSPCSGPTSPSPSTC